MKEIVAADQTTVSSQLQEGECGPFEVVYNHRAAALKKRRKLLRKLNVEKKKKQHEESVRDYEEEEN